MSDNKSIQNKEEPLLSFWKSIKKNGFTIVMVIVMMVMLFVPDAKSFVLRQLMVTGFFNASIETERTDEVSPINTDFDFADENGVVRNTSSLRGKVVFINFWASWCPPCRAEFPSIETLYTKFKDNPDVFFLTINQDSDPAAARSFLQKEKYTVPTFLTTGDVPQEIYKGTLPTTIVLNKNGKIIFHDTGFANYASDKFIKQIEQFSSEQ